MTTMKAVQYAEYGGPDRLKLVDVPIPTEKADEIRVKVLASSVNPIDWKLASGQFRLLIPVARPAVPGFDVVGEVLAAGTQMSEFSVGQRVVARLDTKAGGACAQQCVVSKAQAVALPDAITAADAAALPLAGMTALQALRDDCGLNLESSDERVLVVGASGGVGHYAVQLAAASGAHVTGVCSAANLDLVKELGAHTVIDYREKADFDTGAPYDVILDCAGKAEWKLFEACLSRTGRISRPAPPPAWLPRMLAMKAFSPRTATATMLKPNAADLKFLIDRMSAGTLRSVVGAHFDLTSVAQAWDANIKGGVAGKIVIDVA